MKRNRTFRVAYKHYIAPNNYFLANTYTQVPEIRFGGKWLEEIGFDTGKQINMTIEPGKLIVTLAGEEINAAPGASNKNEN